MGEQSTDQVYASDRLEVLRRLSRDELIDLLLQAESEAKGDIPIAFQRPVATRPFSLPWKAEEFVKLPADPPNELATTWQLVLISFDLSHPIVGLEIQGDVLIGRANERSQPELDLTPLEGLRYGVSRRHAQFQPAAEELLLVDIGSTNGTYRNGLRMRVGEPQALEEKDTITFGNLTFHLGSLSRFD